MTVTTAEQLRELYGWPSGRAEIKVLDELEEHAINFISKSPFLVLSTSDSSGKHDASPRGGNPGFVKVFDNRTLLIPDSKGNNRVDSLVNIVETRQVGILFMIPGIDETLRVNGTAIISTDKSYISMFPLEKNVPKTCLVIEIKEMFLHCAKALMRSKLWDESSKFPRELFPTIRKMLNDQLKLDNPEETREEMIKRYESDL